MAGAVAEHVRTCTPRHRMFSRAGLCTRGACSAGGLHGKAFGLVLFAFRILVPRVERLIRAPPWLRCSRELCVFGEPERLGVPKCTRCTHRVPVRAAGMDPSHSPCELCVHDCGTAVVTGRRPGAVRLTLLRQARSFSWGPRLDGWSPPDTLFWGGAKNDLFCFHTKLGRDGRGTCARTNGIVHAMPTECAFRPPKGSPTTCLHAHHAHSQA